MTQTKSNGHIGYQISAEFGEFEWYEADGEVYRANARNPVQIDGYRGGGRWECSLVRFERDREFYRTHHGVN